MMGFYLFQACPPLGKTELFDTDVAPSIKKMVNQRLNQKLRIYTLQVSTGTQKDIYAGSSACLFCCDKFSPNC